MAARYFIVGETGDAGAWLVDVEAGTVARINADDLAAGKDVPDGDLVANLVEMRLDRNFTIFQGVSLAVAAESLADGAMYNTGQSCCSVERIYVHERLHDAFVEHFLTTVASFKQGDVMDAATYIGAITRAPQLDALDAQVADALAKGATLRCGG